MQRVDEARLCNAPADTGCHLHPKCLECPEPVCIEEVNIPRRDTRAAKVASLTAQGLSAADVAEKLNISVASVVLHRSRWKSGEPGYKIFSEDDVKFIRFMAGKVARRDIARMLGISLPTLNRFTKGMKLAKSRNRSPVSRDDKPSGAERAEILEPGCQPPFIGDGAASPRPRLKT